MAKHVGVSTKDFWRLMVLLVNMRYTLSWGGYLGLVATLKRMRTAPLPTTIHAAQRELHEHSTSMDAGAE